MKHYLLLTFQFLGKCVLFLLKVLFGFVFFISCAVIYSLLNIIFGENDKEKEKQMYDDIEREQKAYWNRTGRYAGDNEKRWYE